MGLIAVAPGEVAAVVTSLEMLSRPLPAPLPDSPLRLVRWVKPLPAAYRVLFERVGAPWLWFSRLILDDDALSVIIHDRNVLVAAVSDRSGIEVGLLELDFRGPHACGIAYFGLVPELAGKGHGRWLMAQCLALAWRPGVERVWVHTCTLDHPGALRFYQRQGFVAFKRQLETFADPRLTGALPAASAPQVPLLSRR